MKNEQISGIRLVFAGQVRVNIPVIATIVIVWFCSWYFLNLIHVISLLAGSFTGWILWGYLIKKWIRWAHKNNFSKERILKLGRLSLLLWRIETIEKALN